MKTATHLLPALALLALAAAAPAHAASLHALTGDGKLVAIDPATRKAGRAVAVTGAGGKVLAIAMRPSDGKLYGVTDRNQLVTIDAKTGRATTGATLDKPVVAGGRVAINFNPTVDRLRIVGIDGTNHRANVDNGQVTVDGGLKYAPGTPLSGTAPSLAAAAYTNHAAGAKETALYTIDALLGQINLQAPPNEGVQQPKKQVAGGLPRLIGFDILTDASGANAGYLLADGKLWGVAVADLALTELGPVTGLPATGVVSMAAAK